MKKQYENPEIEVLLFDKSDAVLTAAETSDGDIEFGFDDLA